ncbi:MAG: C40 family peptidase [Lachnospiraceae bacterium]|nr:C40 family peptidase [Lachnospiraceae bacterium]
MFSPDPITITDDTVTEEAGDTESLDMLSLSVGAEQVISDTEELEERLDAASEAVSAVSLASKAASDIKVAEELAIEEQLARDPENFANLVIAQVNDYVNVRAVPDLEGEIVGKLYDDSVGTFIEETDGWYKISSGSTTGYVKAEYCVTGEDAIELAKKVGTRLAYVDTTTLNVRKEPGLDAKILTQVPYDDDLVVLEEMGDWIKVTTNEGDGYVSSEFVKLHTEFVKAESKAEEEARLKKEAEERKRAQEAARKAQEKRNRAAGGGSKTVSTTPVTVAGSGLGAQVANYGCQFVGNPYVYGGSSLTNGTDCSGFVMSVYAHFGVGLPHSSRADRGVGYAVEGGIANARPGDIICYSGHVAIYIGNGQIVHASTSRTGIIVSSAGYKNILAVRRIF